MRSGFGHCFAVFVQPAGSGKFFRHVRRRTCRRWKCLQTWFRPFWSGKTLQSPERQLGLLSLLMAFCSVQIGRSCLRGFLFRAVAATLSKPVIVLHCCSSISKSPQYPACRAPLAFIACRMLIKSRGVTPRAFKPSTSSCRLTPVLTDRQFGVNCLR